MAGKRKGKEDERHLWPEMLRAIREIKPKYIVGENVFGLLNWNGGMVFNEVHIDLESAGYEVQAVVIPAAAVNAPHGRDRVWFVAYRNNNGSVATEDGQGMEQGDERNEKRQNQTSKFEGCSKSDATNATNSNGNERCNIYRQKTSKWRENQTHNGIANNGSNEYATDTECEGLEGHNREWEGCPVNRSNKGIFVGTKNKRTTTNTNGNGFDQRNGNDEVITSEGRINAQCNTNTGNVDGDATDSTSTRRGEDNGQRKSRFNDQNSSPNDWDNFPTQSPICGGDDGLPTELDGITFSKWRNESIKGYGNAIVPQVAYEIFKVLQHIDDSLK